MPPRPSAALYATLAGLMVAAIGLQAARDRGVAALPPATAEQAVLYVQSGSVARRIALSYDALAADVYWMRALQHFGRTRLSADPNKRYDLLYPLLNLTTTLDPDFEIAYRYGAVFLAEEFPGGAGRPDLAIKLLEKGMGEHPTVWQYPQDIGFVHYWWLRDFQGAATWFRKAAALPGAPPWLEPMAAVSLTEGGNRESARRLWQQVLNGGDADWLRDQAQLRLMQLDALDQLVQLETLVRTFAQRAGRSPASWQDLVAAGWLRGVPTDPHGFPYQLGAGGGFVALAPDSTLRPLPDPDRRQQ